ncbi:hypothetical protein Scani_38000 [Streptomyces caniferus]|uniref:Uncharacterized protein n=1 Tax=Streptomyces caniferus TaxID=285557 RepID=A0A640SAG9_9ACTN|nr:hypothetical protein Scani_38000 [Streptomyces caniferus]
MPVESVGREPSGQIPGQVPGCVRSIASAGAEQLQRLDRGAGLAQCQQRQSSREAGPAGPEPSRWPCSRTGPTPPAPSGPTCGDVESVQSFRSRPTKSATACGEAAEADARPASTA